MTDTVKPDQRRAGGWVVVWGVLLMIAGLLAIVIPAPAALAFALVLGWLLVFAGVFEIAHAIHQRAEPGFAWKIIVGVVTLAVGVMMLVSPVAAISSLALLFGAFLLASGVSTVMLALKLKPKAGWGWVLFDGLLSIVIALLIALGWPQNSIAFVGILVGICMISGGFWRIVLGRALRAGQANVT